MESALEIQYSTRVTIKVETVRRFEADCNFVRFKKSEIIISKFILNQNCTNFNTEMFKNQKQIAVLFHSWLQSSAFFPAAERRSDCRRTFMSFCFSENMASAAICVQSRLSFLPSYTAAIHWLHSCKLGGKQVNNAALTQYTSQFHVKQASL